jgi:YmgG-like glycine-zipper protein
MKSARTTILRGILVTVVLAGLATSGMAQFANQSAIRDVVRRIQTRTDSLQRAAQNASDRNAYRIDDLNRLISDFEVSVNQLDRRLSSGRANSSDARAVLDRASSIDSFFTSNRIGAGTGREWQSLRSDLDQLAGYFNLSTSWGTSTGGNYGGGYNDYNLSDSQMRQLVQQINTRTTTFSRTFRNDLNRGPYRDSSADEIRSHLSEFETSMAQLRNRVYSRQSSSSDVREVLEHASYLNNYIGNRRLSYQTSSNWNLVRNDLNRLASAYNIAWNWSNLPNGNDNDNSGRRADLTGTFRLNSSRGDDARAAVDAATRNLSLAERQRVYDSLLRRLDPPNMLAIDRRGTQVTIASTRAPQINFTVDGREQVETTQTGRSIRVRATFQGDALTISRSGERANDFTVTFDPVENGRQMLVTRTLYSDRVTQPVVVRTYYDRTSDVAELNIYDTNREDVNTGGVAGNFVIPDGTQLVAVLNSDLSTQNVRQNDRFTMTVRSPGQYEGATIEGYVASIERSGRISGRSQMTLDFDNIRLRDGRTYRFAGILESVRTPDGDVVRVDNEGAVRDSNQTSQTVQRTAIGTAVGAIIGAIAGGGKGAAIGAVIGAGAGAGSVYVQGRNDLNLQAGTEVTVRATGPRG